MASEKRADLLKALENLLDRLPKAKKLISFQDAALIENTLRWACMAQSALKGVREDAMEDGGIGNATLDQVTALLGEWGE